MPEEALGVVPLEGRGTLPLVLLHGLPLFLHAVRTLRATPGVDEVVVTAEPGQQPAVRDVLRRSRVPAGVVTAAQWWGSGVGVASLVLLDPLCPLVPVDFVVEVRERAAGGAAAGYRPVTDTVKSVVDQQIVGTLDRDRLAIVTSPVVVPSRLVEAGLPAGDFALLAAWLRERDALTLVKAPSMARRVGDESAVQLLECLDELARQVQEV